MEMKNKKKLIKRIGAVLCAIVIAVSSMGMSGTYYADILPVDILASNKDKLVYYCDSVDFEMPASGYDNYALFHNSLYDSWTLYLFNSEKLNLRVRSYTSSAVNESVCCFLTSSISGGGCIYRSSNNFDTWTKVGNSDIELFEFSEDRGQFLCYYEGVASWSSSPAMQYHSSSVPIYMNDVVIFNGDEGFSDPMGKYNPTLGYLKNVRVENQYLRGEVSIGGVDLPLYYDDALDTLKRVWKFDTVSSSGVDLSSGYSVRHYIKMATVEGYDKEDIIEMSDMYLMGEYDASVGRLEYMEKDYDEKLVQLGYEELGFFDTVFKGLFTLQHHYFQIVNTSTNEVGGYLHVFPQNKDGNLSFEVFGNEGVELGFEGLDENLNVDIEAPSGEVGESVGHGDTYEDAEQQAQETQLRIEGMDQFVLSVESYASQVRNVSKGVGAFLGSLPPWVLGLFGLGVAITFIVIVIKGIRG